MYNYSSLIRLGWDEYARMTKAERNITDEYSIVKLFTDMLPKKSSILDIGCGSGQPITKYLKNNGHILSGIDISPMQVKKAKLNLPGSNIYVADMINHKYPDKYYDATILLHSLEHVERIQHLPTLKKINKALKPGGLMLISLNTISKEGIYFLNPSIQMFFSHFDHLDTIRYILAANFSILYKKVVSVSGKNYIYVIAKKSGTLSKQDNFLVYSAN